MTPAVISFSAGGAELAARIAAAVDGRVHHCGFNGEDARAVVPRLFAEGTPIIGVCAAGILIRLLAPDLADKHDEPPVLAVSLDGSSVVPLLGGHRGANRMARELAQHLGAHAALTTASESRFSRALDDPPPGWELSHDDDAKPAMMSLLVGAKIALDGNAPWIAEAGYPVSSLGQMKVLVTEQKLKVERGLVYHPKTLVAGVGCERHADPAEVIELIRFALSRDNLSRQSLAAIATVDIKADEPAMLAAAAYFGVPLRLFTVAELNQERYRLANPSAIVEAEIGTPSVAEASALKAGKIAVLKIKSRHATCAIGRATRPIEIESFGRAPGRLHLVGIGPGDPANRTFSAVSALDCSSDWVGYGLYLDLIGDLRIAQQEHRFELGDEEVRVRHALELAGSGRTVALVCSGDSQIYAMASLVYELLDAKGERAVSDPARRVAIETHPGISAFQAASAAAGALIGHDFCCISLSDLLTSRDEILERLDSAGRADFVVALYNPRSQRRNDLIEEAKTRLLFFRGPAAPVVIARNLGRADESVTVVPLAEFEPHTIDMMTIVLIGASGSRAFVRGDGRTVAYTPRGYAAKAEQSGRTAVAPLSETRKTAPASETVPALETGNEIDDSAERAFRKMAAEHPPERSPEPALSPPLSDDPAAAPTAPAASPAPAAPPPLQPQPPAASGLQPAPEAQPEPAASAPPPDVPDDPPTPKPPPAAPTGAIRAGMRFLRERVRAPRPATPPESTGNGEQG